jgi:hypothetical protein
MQQKGHRYRGETFDGKYICNLLPVYSDKYLTLSIGLPAVILEFPTFVPNDDEDPNFMSYLNFGGLELLQAMN